jgi:lysophospholipase L1-like esterase
VGTQLALSATASSGLTVSFASTTSAVCTVSGVTANFIAAGTCNLQATQVGNSTYAAAAPVSQSFTVNGETQTITFGTISTQQVGTQLALSATTSSGLSVSFASTTQTICTVFGTTASLIAGGTCNLQATQAGNSTYAAANAVSQSFTVNNLAPTIASISPHFVVAGAAAQNITLMGTNFLPSTTAAYAGTIHTINYVNSTTITLPLSVTDLTAVGIQTIILTNPAPGGGTAAVSLFVLYETDAMLADSQLAAGDQARMQRLIEKGRNGTPVTIAAIGGSITECAGASDVAHCYPFLVQAWWNSTFPSSPSTLVDAGIGATSSDYGSLRVQRDVLAYNPDLVIVEFAVNDDQGGDSGLSQYGDTYEGLVRQLLDAPSHPAVILLFMTKYQLPVVEAWMTAQSWQSNIGANYNVPMVSYYDAIIPEYANGNITSAEITVDGTHPTDLGHAYTAQFLEQNLQLAIDNFPSGTALETIPATQAPLISSDFEFTSMEDGIGANGPALNPTSNLGWIAEPFASDPTLGPTPDPGLQSSTPGSTLDFTVTGKEILVAYYAYNGPMGQASVTVDGVAAPSVLDSYFLGNYGFRIMTRVANSLASGPHQVHIDLLSTMDSGSSGTTFRLLCVGTGGVP